jgi:hypothetical protein
LVLGEKASEIKAQQALAALFMGVPKPGEAWAVCAAALRPQVQTEAEVLARIPYQFSAMSSAM